MSSACSQAVRLPEIVAAILEHLDDKKALFAALQVNRLWSDEATTLLWLVDPPHWAFSNIKDAERLQYYAKKISSLGMNFFDHDWKEFGALGPLWFPRLTKISTETYKYADEQTLLQYLQPSLQTLKSFRGPISEELLLHLQTRCPALQELLLSGPWGSTISFDLLRYLKKMPSLTRIHLDVGLEDVMFEELCFHLASRENLLSLILWDSSFTQDQTIKICAAIADPYRKLTNLSCFSEGRAFKVLSRHLCNLKSLRLRLVDAFDNVLFAISSCINLAKIDVWFKKGSNVPAEGLLSIAKKCPHLRVLNLYQTKGITVDGRSTTNGRSITDDIIKQVATLLPAITEFRIGIEADLSVTALQYLGDLCTRLTTIFLTGIFDLEHLSRTTSAPLFPHLSYIKLEKVSENFSLEETIFILRQQAPQLRKFKGSGGQRWCLMLEKE